MTEHVRQHSRKNLPMKRTRSLSERTAEHLESPPGKVMLMARARAAYLAVMDASMSMTDWPP